MRLTVLACWAVVTTLVVVEAKPYSPPAFDIAAAYEAYHQLWMSEAQRNAVRPLTISQQVARARPWAAKRPALRRKVVPSAPVEEKAPQEKLTAGPEAEKPMVDQKAKEQGPQNPQEAVAAVRNTETQMAAKPETPARTTDDQTQAPVTDEPTTTEAPVQATTTEMQTQEPTTTPASTQATADVRSRKMEASPRRQSFTPIARRNHPTTHLTAAFDNFFDRWNAERIRNSIAPVATPIPPLSTYYHTKETKVEKQPVASKPVDLPAETPATPTLKASVDTLTQEASPSAPAATTAVSPAVTAALNLAQPANWGQQGNAPLIIILQQPGAGVPSVIG